MSTTDDVADLRPLWARLAEAFPRGGMLPDENWRRRHIALTLILLWHFPVVLGYGLYRGYPVAHSFVDAAAPLVFGAVAFCRSPAAACARCPWPPV